MGRDEFDLYRYLRILRRRKWIVLGTLAIFIGVAAGLSAVMTAKYSSQAVVLVAENLQSTVDPLQAQAAQSTEILQRQLQNEITFAEGDAVRSMVRSKLGSLPSIAIAALPDADALSFTATSTNARQASAEANEYASAYLAQRRQSKTSDYLQTAEVIQQQITRLRHRQSSGLSGAASQSAIATLQASQADLRASGDLSQVGGSIVSRANASSTPVSPNAPRNLALGAFLGLLVGVWLAFMVDHADDSVKSVEDLESEHGGSVVLGVIPWTDAWRDGASSYNVSLALPHSPAAEAYRHLRTTVSLLSLDKRIGKLAVTSSQGGEGKSATVANLGVALARAGRRVTIVDCDLRRPRVHAFFDIENSVGLTSVLLGEASVGTAVQEVRECPGLFVLPSGPQPANPSEVLASERVPALFDEIRDHFGSDVVLIDTTPMLPVPDAMQVSRMVDRLLIVVAAGKVRKRQVRRMLGMLQQVSAPILGMVLNGVTREEGEDYGYYTYDYRGMPPAEAGPAKVGVDR